METTSFDRGPMLGYHIGYTVRFCNEECLKHYHFHRSSSHTEIIFHKRTAQVSDSDIHFLTIVCGVLGTNLERSRVIAQFYCDVSQNKKVYVLLQMRSVPKQRFLAFSLSDDFLPLVFMPNPVSLTDEDRFMIASLQLIIKSFLEKLDIPNLLTCITSILGEDSSKQFAEQTLKVPPLQPSLCVMPSGFYISQKDQTIICPHPYNIVLHKTNKRLGYSTYLLLNSAANIQEGSQFVVLFHNNSVDCKVKIVYAVEDSLDAVTVKKLEGVEPQPLLSPYDDLLMECCKEIVCVEITSMLQERGFDHLGDFITNYK